MSEPEIWTIKMADHPKDDFVRLSAYKALDLQRAEVMVDYARLKAEVERLRKAGDWMCGLLRFDFVTKEWNAAKEGKQS